MLPIDPITFISLKKKKKSERRGTVFKRKSLPAILPASGVMLEKVLFSLTGEGFFMGSFV